MLTWLEIDARAIQHNLRAFKKKVGKNSLLMPVIKSNAYGHGFLEVAKLCAKSGEVDRLCVASLDEALTLIKARIIEKPILILSFYELDKEKIAEAIRSGVIFTVYSKEQALFLERIAARQKRSVRVHLKIDTGTSRVGVLPEQVGAFVKNLVALRSLVLEGVWTHLAASESDSEFTKEQVSVFNSVQQELEPLYPSITQWHVSCTAAIMLTKKTRTTAVRLGIGLYGLYPSPATKQRISLRPALSWYTRLLQVKIVPKGTSIGYDRTFVTQRKTVLGIIPVGYYDGYDRLFSNQAKVIVRGKKCSILGRICMNLSMVDLTTVTGNIAAGEIVTLIGGKPKSCITADYLASVAKTINYEIVARINPVLPRIVI